MALESDADRVGMLSDFGENYVVNNKTYTGIFDNEYIEELNMSGSVPILNCRTKDVATVDRGDTLHVREANYTVKEKQPDELGLTILILQKQ